MYGKPGLRREDDFLDALIEGSSQPIDQESFTGVDDMLAMGEALAPTVDPDTPTRGKSRSLGETIYMSITDNETRPPNLDEVTPDTLPDVLNYMRMNNKPIPGRGGGNRTRVKSRKKPPPRKQYRKPSMLIPNISKDELKKMNTLADDAVTKRRRARIEKRRKEVAEQARDQGELDKPDIKQEPGILSRSADRIMDTLGLTNREDAIDYGVGDRWGMAIGEGLAALGDAMVGAGGGKTSFLQSVQKQKEIARERPWQRMKEFNKMLQTEVEKERLEQQRAFMRGDRDRTYDLAKEQAQMDIPGNDLAKGVFQTWAYSPDPWKRKMHDLFPDFYKSYSVKALTDLGQKKVTKGAKRGRASGAIFNIASSSKIKPYVMDYLKDKDGENLNDIQAARKFKNLSKDDLDLYVKRIQAQKKEIMKLHKFSNADQEFVSRMKANGEKLLRKIMKDNGINKASWEDFVIGGNKIFFQPKDRSKPRVEIDIAGFQVPGLKERFVGGDFLKAIDGFLGNDEEVRANEISQLVNGILAPIRKKDFGASQSAIEMDKFQSEIGLNRMGTEAGLFDFIKRTIERTGDMVRRRNNDIKAYDDIGERFLKERKALNYDSFMGEISLGSAELTNNIMRRMERRERKGEDINLMIVPELDEAYINIHNILKKKGRALYQSEDGSKFTAIKKKGYKPHNKWKNIFIHNFLKTVPDDVNINNPAELENWMNRRFFNQ